MRSIAGYIILPDRRALELGEKAGMRLAFRIGEALRGNATLARGTGARLGAQNLGPGLRHGKAEIGLLAADQLDIDFREDLGVEQGAVPVRRVLSIL